MLLKRPCAWQRDKQSPSRRGPFARPQPGCDLPAAVSRGRRSGHLHRLAARPGAGGPSPLPAPPPPLSRRRPLPSPLPAPPPARACAVRRGRRAGAARITRVPFLHRAATCPVAKQWSLFLWRLQRLLLIAEAPRSRSIAPLLLCAFKREN